MVSHGFQEAHARRCCARGSRTYRMAPVAGALEVHHAVKACKCRPIALAAVAVELLLGEDVPTALFAAVRSQRQVQLQGGGGPLGERGMAPGGITNNIPRRRTRPWRTDGQSVCKMAVYSWQDVNGR
jgi:hypothetical protein